LKPVKGRSVQWQLAYIAYCPWRNSRTPSMVEIHATNKTTWAKDLALTYETEGEHNDQ